MRTSLTILFSTIALTAAGAAAYAQSARMKVEPRVSGTPTAPVLVELFTSQGCSSCPPADRFAHTLATRANIVAVSRPVTYWDRLGWKDTLAREENTQLQRAYAGRGLAGRNGVYTPQIVVDGNRGAIGSDRRSIDRMIAQEASAPAAISVRKQPNGALVIGVAGKANRPAELVLLAMASRVDVQIYRGENGNRNIGYSNVLRQETRVTDWQGGKASAVIAPSLVNRKDADRYALVLREQGAGPVLAARMID